MKTSLTKKKHENFTKKIQKKQINLTKIHEKTQFLNY